MTVFGLHILVYLIILAIATLTFFLLRWTLKKFIKGNVTRKRLTWVGTIVLTPLFCVGLVIGGMFYEYYYPARDFNESSWRVDKEKRYEMTEDLIESEILLGKTKEEVRLILGNDFHLYSEDRWVYDIGFIPGLMNIDMDLLTIDFKNGKVEKVDQQAT